MRAFEGPLRLVAMSAVAWVAALGVGAAQTTTRVSTSAASAQGNGASDAVASADGRYVAFRRWRTTSSSATQTVSPTSS